MSNSPLIVCKPSKWFKIRAILVLVMLAFFGGYFFVDGKWGYRKKNVQYVENSLFRKASDKKAEMHGLKTRVAAVFSVEKFPTEESWKEFAKAQSMPLPKDAKDVLPLDYNFEKKWPEEVVNGYAVLKNDSDDVQKLWKAYSGRMKYNEEAPDKLADVGTIKEQFYWAIGTGVIFLIAAFICLRIMLRNMTVTDTAYIAPGGKEVPFSAMKKIDKRKWGNKGLALIYYGEGDNLKKVKVDGMVYGQFKEEDGAPAEKLFSHIMDNFHGELVEYVTEDEEENDDESAEAVKSAENG